MKSGLENLSTYFLLWCVLFSQGSFFLELVDVETGLVKLIPRVKTGFG